MNVFQALLRNEEQRKEDMTEKVRVNSEKLKPMIGMEKEASGAETLLILIEVEERMKPLKR